MMAANVADGAITAAKIAPNAITTFLNEGGAGILFLSPNRPLTDWEKKLLPTLTVGPERNAGNRHREKTDSQHQTYSLFHRHFLL